MLYPAELRARTPPNGEAKGRFSRPRPKIQAKPGSGAPGRMASGSSATRWSNRAFSRRSAFRSSCITTHISMARSKPSIGSGDEVGIAGGDRRLARAETDAGPHQGELAELAVGADGEQLAGDGDGQVPDAGDLGRDAVEADQGVGEEVVDPARHAMLLQVGAVAVEDERDRADAAGEQRVLGRAGHAHGDVGVAAQQVLLPVGEDELDVDLAASPRGSRSRIGGSTSAPTISLAVRRTTPLMARASPAAVRTRVSAAAAMARACGSRARAARVGVRPPGERVNRGSPASAASSASICRPTVGWATPKRARGAGKAAGLHHRQEGPPEAPVGVSHARMYIDRTLLDNSE